MGKSPPHRKRIRHYDEPGHGHELTFSCYQRLPLLMRDTWCRLLAEGIDRAMGRHDTDLIAFVFMPEHVHLIVRPRAAQIRIDQVLYAIKRPVAYQIKAILTRENDPLLARLTVHERQGKSAFRFWQAGGGYDRNLHTAGAMRAAVDYIHANPVRRGLCGTIDQWLWSSWRQYERPDSCTSVVPAVAGLDELLS